MSLSEMKSKRGKSGFGMAGRGVSVRWGGRLLSVLMSVFLCCGSVVRGEDRQGDQAPRKIIGGVPSAAGAYPWMVAILQTDLQSNPFFAQYCAGTLIAPRWVLSAAHCFSDGGALTPPADVLVMIGEIELEPGPTLYAVDRIIVHEDFSDVGNARPADIALLRLAEPVDFPTLPLNELANNPLAEPGDTARIIGWGSRMWDEPNHSPFDFPTDLHEADLPIVSNPQCQAALAGVIVDDNELCAGNLAQGGVDTCAGDSGGPIFVADGQNGFLQIGITSFGLGCALPNRPGVYTRVSSYIDWIEQNMAQTVVIPHWGNGQGLVTDLIVYNLSSTLDSDSVIGFRDGNGIDVPMGTLLSQTTPQTLLDALLEGNQLHLPPLGIQTISTSGLGNLTSGSIQLRTQGEVGAAIRFRISGIGISGVGSALPAASLIAPARRQGSLNTGVAIHNPSGEAVTVDLILSNGAGQEVANGQAVLELPARGQVARFIHELFPNANTANFQGSILVRARTGVVAAVALELGSQPGEFTTSPVSATR